MVSGSAHLAVGPVPMPSLTREGGCSLQWNHSVIQVAQDHNYTLPSHLRRAQPVEAQAPVFIFPRNPFGAGFSFCRVL
jgi:hypothetical protein